MGLGTLFVHLFISALTCRGHVFFANVTGTFFLLVVTCALFPKVQPDETEFMFKVIETTLTFLQICCRPDLFFTIYLKK